MSTLKLDGIEGLTSVVIPVGADGTPISGGAATPYTLLTNAAATGTGVTIVRGTYTWSVYGTWNGATAQLQRSPDGGTTWVDVDGAAFSANGGALNMALPAGKVRVAISGAGGSTSLSSTLEGS